MKTFQKIYVILFFIIIIIPVGCMGFVSSDINENRELSTFPAWTNEDGTWNSEYFDELTTYVAEHFAFRDKLVALDGKLKYTLFDSPSDEQVILGKGDWMYFEPTLEDYAGVTLSQDEIDQIADKLADVYAYIESKGKTPLFMVAPNKNTIYPENMPQRFGEKATVTNMTMLYEALDERGVNYLNAADILITGKGIDEMYLHTDTHWNDTGARIVMNEIFEAWGLEDEFTIGNYTLEAVHEPDLYSILFPTDGYLENQHVYPDKEAAFSYEGRVRSLDDMTITTIADNGNGKKALIFRDSFGRAMIPYMGNIFDQCTFNRSTPYNISVVDEVECDYVLIEIVERNIIDLAGIEVPKE